jgi:hypothetical protein
MHSALTSRTAIALIAIFLLALTLRLAWIANTDTTTPPLSDPQYYHATAQNLADGRGYTVAVDEHGFVPGPQGEATAFWPPGYSFALAPTYALFGDEQRVAKTFNALIGALTVIPIYFIAANLAVTGKHRAPHTKDAADTNTTSTADLPLSARRRGRRPQARRGEGVRHLAGLLAAALYAIAPAMIYWTPVLFADPLLAFGAATSFALAIWSRQPADDDVARVRVPYIVRSALVGLTLAATAMVKPQTLVFALPIAILLVPKFELHAIARALAPAAIAGLLLIVPWTIRNQAAMGEAYVISGTFCYNLRASHAPYSTGGSVPPQDLWDEQPGITFREREALFDDLGCERAWDYAREHPRRELELAPKKIGWLLRSDAAHAIDWSRSLDRTLIHRGDADAFVLIGDVIWYATLALAFVSPFVLPRTRVAIALWIALLVWAAFHLAFHGEPRYHVAVLPLLCALGATTLVQLAERVTRSLEPST